MEEADEAAGILDVVGDDNGSDRAASQSRRRPHRLHRDGAEAKHERHRASAGPAPITNGTVAVSDARRTHWRADASRRTERASGLEQGRAATAPSSLSSSQRLPSAILPRPVDGSLRTVPKLIGAERKTESLMGDSADSARSRTKRWPKKNRELHNHLEKKRRATMRFCLEELQRRLYDDSGDAPHLSIASIMQVAADYISFLEELTAQQLREIEWLSNLSRWCEARLNAPAAATLVDSSPIPKRDPALQADLPAGFTAAAHRDIAADTLSTSSAQLQSVPEEVAG